MKINRDRFDAKKSITLKLRLSQIRHLF